MGSVYKAQFHFIWSVFDCSEAKLRRRASWSNFPIKVQVDEGWEGDTRRGIEGVQRDKYGEESITLQIDSKPWSRTADSDIHWPCQHEDLQNQREFMLKIWKKFKFTTKLRKIHGKSRTILEQWCSTDGSQKKKWTAGLKVNKIQLVYCTSYYMFKWDKNSLQNTHPLLTKMPSYLCLDFICGIVGITVIYI